MCTYMYTYQNIHTRIYKHANTPACVCVEALMHTLAAADRGLPVCACACVINRDRQRKRDTKEEKERKKEGVCVCVAAEDRGLPVCARAQSRSRVCRFVGTYVYGRVRSHPSASPVHTHVHTCTYTDIH